MLDLENMFGTLQQHTVIDLTGIESNAALFSSFASWLITAYADADKSRSVLVIPGRWRTRIDPSVFCLHNVSVTHDGNGPGNPLLGRASAQGIIIYLDLFPYLKSAAHFDSVRNPASMIFNQINSGNGSKRIVFTNNGEYFESLSAVCQLTLVGDLNQDSKKFLLASRKDTRRRIFNIDFEPPRTLQAYSDRVKQLENTLRDLVGSLHSTGVLISSNDQLRSNIASALKLLGADNDG
jgi:hypothetical protein